METQVSHKYTVATIALAVTFALVGVLYIPLFLKPPTEGVDLAKEALMTLKDAFLIIIGFFFGSSLGSRQKDSKTTVPDQPIAPEVKP